MHIIMVVNLDYENRVAEMRIKCYSNLYVSELVKKRKNKVLTGLMEQKFQPGITVITLASGEQNHLEFFQAFMLRQHFYDEKELFVVGLAEGYEDAAELVEQIVQKVVDETGGTDIRSYILKEQKNFEESRAKIWCTSS